MAGLRMLRRMEDRFGNQVANLFGLNYAPVDISVQRGLTQSAGDGRVAQGGAGAIIFDRAWLKSATRADVRGALIHETAHALGAGARYPRQAETYADYARYMLNPKEASYWKPTDAVLAMAKKRGDVTAPNRPRQGRGGGHNRTAGTDQRSGNNGNLPSTPAAPPLPPGQAAAYNAQFVANEQARINAYAAIRMQGGQIRADARNALADSRYQRIQEAVGAENDALARGVIGSSGDLGARASVAASAAGRAVDIRSAKLSGLAQLRIAGMQADTEYMASNAGVLADQAAAQAELANQRYQNDLIATQTANFKALMNKYYRMLVARGKNPPGVDPRAADDPTNGLVRPYGGQYSGKVERDNYYRNPIAGTPWATGGGLG